ncbi:MAG: DNA-3-methyladenine glycosylase I [Flavipsychrobacter sp.]
MCAKNISRCAWPGNDELMQQYHDEEWGVPLYDDRKLFEYMILDAFQAGLSWKTILHRREGFRKAFSNFDVKKVAKYDEQKVEELMQDTGIIRNRLKITGTVTNAQLFIGLQKEHGSFSQYIWQFTDGKPIVNKWTGMGQVPAKSSESDAMSAALKKLGFKFVGSTICYAFMQAAGMVNDHVVDCFRHKQVQKEGRP